VRANALAIIAAHALVLARTRSCSRRRSSVIVVRLPLDADLAALLPRDAPAVRDLRVLEARLRAKDRSSS
jgi:hypothetical protein